jgi:2,4-dienoyl-CoA reductase-like NADH-dependent reductase (Old Yellow Enzyme family)
MWLATEHDQERPMMTDSLLTSVEVGALALPHPIAMAPMTRDRSGADVQRRAQDVADGLADVVTFGRLTLANPDVVERISAGAPFNEPDPATFYGGDEHGYTDYPRLSAATTETER